MNTEKLVTEAISLPVEERGAVLDSILQSLNPPEADIDRQWLSVARQRLAEIRSGSVETVSGEGVILRTELNRLRVCRGRDMYCVRMPLSAINLVG